MPGARMAGLPMPPAMVMHGQRQGPHGPMGGSQRMQGPPMQQAIPRPPPPRAMHQVSMHTPFRFFLTLLMKSARFSLGWSYTGLACLQHSAIQQLQCNAKPQVGFQAFNFLKSLHMSISLHAACSASCPMLLATPIRQLEVQSHLALAFVHSTVMNAGAGYGERAAASAAATAKPKASGANLLAAAIYGATARAPAPAHGAPASTPARSSYGPTASFGCSHGTPTSAADELSDGPAASDPYRAPA